jgi:chemotaxis protein CheX
MTTATLAFPTKIADAVRSSISIAFSSIFGAEPELSDASESPAACACVVGIISFVCDNTWSLALVVPERTAPMMAEKFAGFPIAFDAADMTDAIGELANVLAGEVIAQLDRRGIQARMSLPITLRGIDVETVLPRTVPEMTLAYRLDSHPYWFKMAASKSCSGIHRLSGK